MNNEKESFWFSHDSNARHDPKICSMRLQYGTEGYGLYWAIVEMLRSEADCRLDMNKCTWNAIAMQMQCKPDFVKQFVEDCIAEHFLFIEEDGMFYSHSLIKRLEKGKDISKKRKEAAEARWAKEKPTLKNANAMQKNANAMQDSDLQCYNKTKQIEHDIQQQLQHVQKSNPNNFQKKSESSLFNSFQEDSTPLEIVQSLNNGASLERLDESIKFVNESLEQIKSDGAIHFFKSNQEAFNVLSLMCTFQKSNQNRRMNREMIHNLTDYAKGMRKNILSNNEEPSDIIQSIKEYLKKLEEKRNIRLLDEQMKTS
jgi:hypothetical protein